MTAKVVAKPEEVESTARLPRVPERKAPAGGYAEQLQELTEQLRESSGTAANIVCSRLLDVLDAMPLTDKVDSQTSGALHDMRMVVEVLRQLNALDDCILSTAEAIDLRSDHILYPHTRLKQEPQPAD